MKKKLYHNLSVVGTLTTLLLLSSCSYRHTLEPELESVRKKTLKHTGYDMDWDFKDLVKEEEAQAGLSFETAVRNAILVDPDVRIRFEELGISQADLAQAGFLKNPTVETLFQFSGNCDEKPVITIDAYMNISDFWQIPLRKKVAQDELAASTLAALQRIIEVTAETRTAYYTYLYEQFQYQTTEKIVKQAQELRGTTEKNYSAGYISDYDRYVTDGIIANWELRKLEQERLLYDANIILRNTIGIDPSSAAIKITDLWDTMMRPLPEPKVLFEYAQKNNPNMQILQVRIKQAQHQRALERSKIFDNVEFGVGYIQDVGGIVYWGPEINFDLPIFDQQQNQIERARRTELKVHNEIASLESVLTLDIFKACDAARIAQKKIELYKKMLEPARKKALDFTKQNSRSMNINFVVVVNSELELLQQEYILNREYLNLAIALSTIEKSIGGKIPYELYVEPTPPISPAEEKIEQLTDPEQ